MTPIVNNFHQFQNFNGEFIYLEWERFSMWTLLHFIIFLQNFEIDKKKMLTTTDILPITNQLGHCGGIEFDSIVYG